MSGPQRYQRRSDLVSQRPLTTAIAAAVLLGCAGPAVADPLDDLGTVIAGVRAAVADGRVTQSKILGFENRKGKELHRVPLRAGRPHRLRPRRRQVVRHRNDLRLPRRLPDRPRRRGIVRTRPLPRQGRPEEQAAKDQGARVVHVRARPGYAVGAPHLPLRLLINGLSVTFMRMKDGKLDPQQSYESDWVGDRTGGERNHRGRRRRARRRHLRQPGRRTRQRPRPDVHDRPGAGGRSAGRRSAARCSAGGRSARRPAAVRRAAGPAGAAAAVGPGTGRESAARPGRPARRAATVAGCRGGGAGDRRRPAARRHGRHGKVAAGHASDLRRVGRGVRRRHRPGPGVRAGFFQPQGPAGAPSGEPTHPPGAAAGPGGPAALHGARAPGPPLDPRRPTTRCWS